MYSKYDIPIDVMRAIEEIIEINPDIDLGDLDSVIDEFMLNGYYESAYWLQRYPDKYYYYAQEELL